MNKETKAFKDTAQHIFLVQRLLLSCQLELSRRIVTHDQSKLEEPEWSMFADMTESLAGLTYGSPEYKEQLAVMLPRGLNHHYAHNRHHPEHYADGLEGMNLFDLLEMLVDWMAAVQRHDDGDIQKSLEINGDRFGVSPQLQKIFANTVEYFRGDEFQGLSTQKDLVQPPPPIAV